jgi:hypothetical protein
METSEHVLRNRTAWDQWAADYAGPGLRNWAAAEPSWGIWGIAETEAGVLPPALAGRDSIELRPPPDATSSHPLATLEWARQWPSEEVWKARKLP